jgi:hypothetical protein
MIELTLDIFIRTQRAFVVDIGDAGNVRYDGDAQDTPPPNLVDLDFVSQSFEEEQKS